MSYRRKTRTAIPPEKWSQDKYVKALKGVYVAAEALVSPEDQVHSLAQLVERLERAIDKVPYR